MTPIDMHGALILLANRLARLRPDWRDARGFYEERSEIRAELRALANGPTAVRTVIRPIRVEVPAPAPPPPPVTPGSLPLILNERERQVLAHAVTVTTGGFHAGFTRWHAAVDPATGRLDLPVDDLRRVWGWGSRPWKGGGQSYARKIFWRSVGPLFSALDLAPETSELVSKANPWLRRGKPRNRKNTPRQDAQDGRQAQRRETADDTRRDRPATLEGASQCALRKAGLVAGAGAEKP